METYMIPVAASFLGTLGFSAYYNVGLRISVINAAAGMAGYLVYLFFQGQTGSIFMSNFITAVCMTMMSELCARYYRVPTTMLLVPMLFPEIPGGVLYNAIWSLLVGETEACLSYAAELAVIIAALNLGIVLVTALFRIYTNIRQYF